MSTIDNPENVEIEPMDTSLINDEFSEIKEHLECFKEEGDDSTTKHNRPAVFHHEELNAENEVIQQVEKEKTMIVANEVEEKEGLTLANKCCSINGNSSTYHPSIVHGQQQSQEAVLIKEDRLATGAHRSESSLRARAVEPDHIEEQEETITNQEIIAGKEVLVDQLIENINKEHLEDTHNETLSREGKQYSAEEPKAIDQPMQPLAASEQSIAMESLVITHKDQTTTKFDNDKDLEYEEHESDDGVHGREVEGEQGRDEYESDCHTAEPIVRDDQMKKATEEPIKVAHVKPQSRLVRPPDRVIHTSPQTQVNRAQSAIGSSSIMPKPETPWSDVRAIRPPVPRSFARAAERELVSKKPKSRAQSQPRPSAETKTISQPTTPKVHRKVVTVSSKVGSFTNHKPQGGNVQIFSENRTYNVQSKIGSLNNVSHTPGGGNVRIPNMKLDFKEKATPKIDAKSDYVPLIPEKKAITQKLNWTARSKIGSLDNVKHKPAGGNVQILDQKLQWHATSKVGSRDNIGHKPGGGNVQIFDERIQYVSTDRKSNSGSLSNMSSRSRTASRTTIDVLGL